MEVAHVSPPIWRKTSYSDGAGNNCVEVADFPSGIGVRDSKNKTGPALIVSGPAWASFVRLVRSGRH